MDLSKYSAQWVNISDVDYADKTFQYRSHVVAEDVVELAKSLKANGQDIPIVIRKMQDGKSQIVCGFRRFTAALSLEWEKIRAITVPFEEMPDIEARKLSARENIERGQYSNLDKMFMCKKLSEQNVSNVEIGEIIGKSENQVRRYLKVANSSSDVHSKLEAGELTINDISDNQARRHGEQAVDNLKYTVKSSKNCIDVKMKIEAISENSVFVDAFLADVKKAWKEALKKSKKSVKPGKGSKPKEWKDIPSELSKNDMQDMLKNVKAMQAGSQDVIKAMFPTAIVLSADLNQASGEPLKEISLGQGESIKIYARYLLGSGQWFPILDDVENIKWSAVEGIEITPGTGPEVEIKASAGIEWRETPNEPKEIRVFATLPGIGEVFVILRVKPK